MRNRMKRLIAICLTLVMVAGSVITTNAASGSQADLGALADSYTAGSGTFTLTKSSRVFVVADEEPTGQLLQTAQLINRQFSTEFKDVSLGLVWGKVTSAKVGDIILNLDTSAEIEKEGYELEVTDKAVVAASDVDGLLYGANMIQKYFDVAGVTSEDSVSLSGFTAADTPDTKERTVMLDTGRKYYTAEWIKNFIKQISWMGYNTLQVHVSEDGGFRADFWDPAYYTDNYQPENDFSWLCGSHVQSWVKSPYRTDPDVNKYLTTAELVDICKTAAEYHIDIIPSFDSPAHMDYITWKFEQNYKSNTSYSFTYNGETYKASSTNGCINYRGITGYSAPDGPYTTIDITDGTMSKAFVFALYEDMADFFKEYAGSTDFSIGADEVNLSSSSCKWDYSDFPGYINELNQMLNDKGYTCRMFNDFIGSTTYNQSNSKAIYDFDDNIEIMYWNSDFNPTSGKYDESIWHVAFFWHDGTSHDTVSSGWPTNGWGDGGRTLYNCIQTNTYYVLRVAATTTSYPNYDARNPENYNWTFYHSDEKNIYDEWYPANISESGKKTENAADVPEEHLGGAYFLIWNDYAALNTEAEVWNDVKDNTGTSSYIYSLFDRMASNIIKMWNSDINNTVTFKEFVEVREAIKFFPGYISCSAEASMPEAAKLTRAYAADHTKLEELLAEGMVSNEDEKYTANSYAAYKAAYDKAVDLNANPDAPEEQIADMIAVLKAKKAALVDLTSLKEALAEEINNDDGTYTAESYAIYTEAYKEAEDVLKDPDATASDIDRVLENLETAVNNLTVKDGTTEDKDSANIEVKLMAKSFKNGKQVGLKVTTVAGIDEKDLKITYSNDSTVKEVKLNLVKGKDQTLTTGEAKIWLIKFDTPTKAGIYTYTLTAGEDVETFKFVVK